MNQNLKQLFAPIIPFLILGVFIAVVAAFFIVFAYLVVWGLIIGGIFGVIVYLKNRFFPKKKSKSPQGRIIEHDDIS